MTGRSDPFRTYDAAYVLGALSPSDRAAFEEHLRVCGDCARSVRELAGLPGLLAQVTPETAGEQQPPGGLLPSLLRKVRRLRRSRALVTGGVGLTSAAAVLAAFLFPTAGDGPAGTAMTPLGAFPVQATAAVAPVSGGSRVDLACRYHGAGRGADYLLVAVRRDGTATPLATWWADPERTATLSLDTALPAADIQALEIRTRSGLPLLRWKP